MKIAIVTGASSGIGREFVKQIGHFYHSLDEIWVIARREERLEELKKESTVPLRILSGDLLKRPVNAQLKKMLSEEKPDIRMLVNAAGFGKNGTVEQLLAEDKNSQLEMIDLNCIALSRITFFCLPYMSKGSRIINVASAAAFCPQTSFVVYSATKSYVLSFSRGLGSELKKRGIFVTAVCPGPVDTEFFYVAGGIKDQWKKLVMAKAPQVVRQALLDSKKRKPLSVYGTIMKALHVGSKLAPHGWILKMQALGDEHLQAKEEIKQ